MVTVAKERKQYFTSVQNRKDMEYKKDKKKNVENKQKITPNQTNNHHPLKKKPYPIIWNYNHSWISSTPHRYQNLLQLYKMVYPFDIACPQLHICVKQLTNTKKML